MNILCGAERWTAQVEASLPYVKQFLTEKGFPNDIETREVRQGLHSVVANELNKRGLISRGELPSVVAEAMRRLSYPLEYPFIGASYGGSFNIDNDRFRFVKAHNPEPIELN